MGRILLRVLAGAFALVLALSLLSFHPGDPHFFAQQGNAAPAIRNLCGLVGAYLAGSFQTLIGIGAWLIPIYVLWECFPGEGPKWHRRTAWVVLALSVWTLLGAFGARSWAVGEGRSDTWRWGGGAGFSLWRFFHRLLGPIGLPLVLVTLILLCALVLAPMLTRALGRLLAGWMGDKAWPWLKPLPAKGTRGVLGGLRGFINMVQRPFMAWRSDDPPPELDLQDAKELTRMEDQRRSGEEQVESLCRAERETKDYKRANKQLSPELALPVIHSMTLDTPEGELSDIHSMLIEGDGMDSDIPLPTLPRDLSPSSNSLLVSPPRVDHTLTQGHTVRQQAMDSNDPTSNFPFSSPRHASPLATRRLSEASGPVSRPQSSSIEDRYAPPFAGVAAGGPMDRKELPPRSLFDPAKPEQKLDMAILKSTQDLIGQKLTEFKVKGQMVGMQPGPVVTVYEFQPDPGVPLAKVLNMEEDLALGLQAEKVRIDRISGRNLVGIEVPNARREVISFREVVESPQFWDPSHKDALSLLTMALGKDIAGHPVVSDLAKMPHLLIGGSTGSGKSVGVNAMICSLLLRALPSEVKLILVDPKMVELGIYEDIPHLWAPVVTDMKEAGRVLKWVVSQMEDRYRRLALLSVRNLEGFNIKLIEAGGSIDLSDRTPNPRWPDRPPFLEILPYVVVVIDELADLMMVCRAEVEESIARIAQKARAVGIHLVLATQRPSVDIVTGVIKANLPARLSYRVNTKIDSRTILDGSGGEQLLGKGDALFLAPGNARPRRIHAPLINEDEILRLVDWLKERGRPDYNQALLHAMEIDEETIAQEADEVASGGGDDIYDRALAVVKRERKASTSLLQRKLNIGYGRAARIIDRMQDEDVIGPDRGAGKPREVLVGEE